MRRSLRAGSESIFAIGSKENDMKYKYILFDLDGTLDDPFEGITKSVAHAMNKFGIICDRSKLGCFIGPPLTDSFINYFGLTESMAKKAVEYYREYYRPMGIFEVNIYDGIPDLLARLKGLGCELILATSKPKIFADMILEKYGLMQYFSATFGSELDGTRVKKAEVIAYAHEQHGFDKSQAIMVGDRMHDVEGAHECGIPCIGVTFGYGDRAEHEACGTDYIVDSVAELGKLLGCDMRHSETVIFTNMCMISDGNGNVVMQERRGLWPGYAFPGGHVEAGEAFTDAVIREVYEETGLRLRSVKLCGIKDWIKADGSRGVVHLYSSSDYEGELTASDEGNVMWVPLDSISSQPLASGMESLIAIIAEGKHTEQFFEVVNGEFIEHLK